MRVLSHLFTNNQAWADEITERDPEICVTRTEEIALLYQSAITRLKGRQP